MNPQDAQSSAETSMERSLSLPDGAARRRQNRLLKALGLVFLGLGGLGILLPLMPTTIFWIIAVWCFASSAPELKRWIHEHPQFGTGVRNFTDYGVLSSRGKFYALTGMYGGIALSAWLFDLRAVVWAGIGLGLMPIAIYLLTRPTTIAAVDPNEAAQSLDD